MAVTVTTKLRARLGRLWRLYLTLDFSGSYATPGDTLSFLTRGLSLSGRASNAKPLAVQIYGQGVYRYIYLEGSGRDNGTIKITTNATDVELSDDAYPAGVADDVVTCIADFNA